MDIDAPPLQRDVLDLAHSNTGICRFLDLGLGEIRVRLRVRRRAYMLMVKVNLEAP